MTNRLYNGEPLADNEYLLKVDTDKTGFLTKLTKKGQLPKSFDDWRSKYTYVIGSRVGIKNPPLLIYIHTEVPKEGWKLVKWRIGKSQEWATMMHPDGFTVEIYLSNFLQITLNNTIEKGMLKGLYKWEDNKLIPS